MARIGRPPVLDEVKRGEIAAIVSMGCSRRTAARSVGCSLQTIYNTAERDAKFAAKMSRAKSNAVVMHVKNINSAAKKAQYWRAAAWALERLNPEEYAARRPETVAPEQLSRLLICFSQIIVEEVPVSKYRKRIIKRMEDLVKMIGVITPCEDVKNDDAKHTEKAS